MNNYLFPIKPKRNEIPDRNSKFLDDVFHTKFLDGEDAIMSNSRNPILTATAHMLGNVVSPFIDFSSKGFPSDRSKTFVEWDEKRRNRANKNALIAAGRSFTPSFIPSAVTSRDGINMSKSKSVKGKGLKKGLKKAVTKAVKKSLQQAGPTTVSRAEMNRIYNTARQQKKQADQRNFNRNHPVNRFNTRNTVLRKGSRGHQYDMPLRRGAGTGIYKDRRVTRPAFAGVNARGQGYLFSSGSKPGSLRIKMKQYMGTITYTTTGTTTWTIVNGGGGANCQYYFNPTNQMYVGSGLVQAMSRYFDNYRVNAAEFEFTSSQSPQTAGDYQITWCMCESVDHWEKLGLASGVSQLTKLQVATMPSSMTFSVWEPIKSMGLAPKAKMLYTACDTLNGQYSFGQPISMERQSYAFTAGFVVTGTIPAANVTLGDLWLWVDFELWGMNGQQTQGANYLDRSLMRMEESIEKKYGVSLAEIAEFKKASEITVSAEETMAVWSRFTDSQKDTFNKSFEEKCVDSVLVDNPNVDVWRFKRYYKAMDDLNKDIFHLLISEKGPAPSLELVNLIHRRNALKEEKTKFVKTVGDVLVNESKRVEEKRKVYESHSDDEGDLVDIEECHRPKIVKKKSSSLKSDSEIHRLKKFDSTLGFPGEGPMYVDSESFYSWCEEALLANITFHRTRKVLSEKLNELILEGGDHKLDPSQVIALNSALQVRSQNLTSEAVLAFKTLVTDIYKSLDKEDEGTGAEEPEAGAPEKEKKYKKKKVAKSKKKGESEEPETS